MVATLLWEQGVAGSNPAAPTRKIKGLRHQGVTLFSWWRDLVAGLRQNGTLLRHFPEGEAGGSSLGLFLFTWLLISVQSRRTPRAHRFFPYSAPTLPTQAFTPEQEQAVRGFHFQLEISAEMCLSFVFERFRQGTLPHCLYLAKHSFDDWRIDRLPAWQSNLLFYSTTES